MTHSHIPEKLATGTPISSILALLVLTLVWTPFSASAGTPPGRAQGANDLYWVCTWSIGLGAKPYYVSDVSRADSMAVAMVTNAFRNYVAAKYNLGSNKYAGSASCVYQTSETAAQTLRQRDLAMPPSGYNVIDTRWKYGMQPTAGGASSAQPPTAPNTPASSAAITSSAAESGGYGVYWVCKWDVGSGNARTQYVTDVMGPTQLFAGSMGLFNRFQAFVIAKYNLGNGGLGNMGACEQETTAAEAQAVKKQYLTVLLPGFKALDTGWNYRLQPPGGATQGLSDLPPEPTQFLAARTSKR